MKSNEFLNEGIGHYETILQNLLKEVNRLKKHPDRRANKLGINELLYDLGVGAQWNVNTFDHPLSQPMRREAQEYIEAVTNNFKGTSFSRQDIKHFADTLFQWYNAVKDAPRKPYA